MLFAPRNLGSVWVALCLATACLAGAGCGGKSNASSTGSAGASTPSAVSSTGATTAPRSAASEQQFIAEADAICRQANVQLAKSTAKAETRAAVTAVVVEHEAIERKALGELAKLTVPSALASAWTKMLDFRRTLANKLGDYGAAIRRGETTFTALAQSKKQLHAKLTAVGSKAGFKDCAKIG